MKQDPNKIYAEAMKDAKTNLKKVLYEIQAELSGIVPENKIQTLRKLWKSSDQIWYRFKVIFDAVRNKSQPFRVSVEHLKRLIMDLVAAGIPLDLNKNLNFWSHKMGCLEAVRYSLENGSTTDNLAFTWFKKILLHQKENDRTIFQPLVYTSPAVFPDLASVFWTAVSELYTDAAKPGSEAHFFYVDSIITDNFFGGVEWPKIRQKNLILYLHEYDLVSCQWKPPIKLDSTASNGVYLRRRTVHPMDKPATNPNCVLSEDGEHYEWRTEKIRRSAHKRPIEFFTSPKILTLGRFRELCSHSIKRARDRLERRALLQELREHKRVCFPFWTEDEVVTSNTEMLRRQLLKL